MIIHWQIVFSFVLVLNTFRPIFTLSWRKSAPPLQVILHSGHALLNILTRLIQCIPSWLFINFQLNNIQPPNLMFLSQPVCRRLRFCFCGQEYFVDCDEVFDNVSHFRVWLRHFGGHYFGLRILYVGWCNPIYPLTRALGKPAHHPHGQRWNNRTATFTFAIMLEMWLGDRAPFRLESTQRTGLLLAFVAWELSGVWLLLLQDLWQGAPFSGFQIVGAVGCYREWPFWGSVELLVDPGGFFEVRFEPQLNRCHFRGLVWHTLLV